MTRELEKIKTHNGVSLTVMSWPKEIMTSNRSNAKVKRVDFDQIFTSISLGDNFAELGNTISDLEDENIQISRDAFFYFTSDVQTIIAALGCNADDVEQIITAVMETRSRLRQQKSSQDAA